MIHLCQALLHEHSLSQHSGAAPGSLCPCFSAEEARGAPEVPFCHRARHGGTEGFGVKGTISIRCLCQLPFLHLHAIKAGMGVLRPLPLAQCIPMNPANILDLSYWTAS